MAKITRRAKKGLPDDRWSRVLGLRDPIKMVVCSMMRRSERLRRHAVDDLVNDILIHVLDRIQSVKSDEKAEAWAKTVASNFLLSMMRTKPRETVEVERSTQDEADPVRGRELWKTFGDLVSWLKDNDEVRWRVIKLMAANGGNCSRVAFSLTVLSGEPWTARRVRSVVNHVRTNTPKGVELAEMMG